MISISYRVSLSGSYIKKSIRPLRGWFRSRRRICKSPSPRRDGSSAIRSWSHRSSSSSERSRTGDAFRSSIGMPKPFHVCAGPTPARLTSGPPFNAYRSSLTSRMARRQVQPPVRLMLRIPFRPKAAQSRSTRSRVPWRLLYIRR
jgi:hypothetical protein